MTGVWDAAPSEMENARSTGQAGRRQRCGWNDDTAVPKKGKHSVESQPGRQERHSVENAVLLAPLLDMPVRATLPG
jgi:hypothetical protein